MTRDRFISYIEHPEKLDAATLPELSDIVSEFPFCQSAQLLYLKNLQNEENIRFNKQLKLAALYAGDRRSLFQMLNAQVPLKASHVNESVSKAVMLPTGLLTDDKTGREPLHEPAEEASLSNEDDLLDWEEGWVEPDSVFDPPTKKIPIEHPPTRQPSGQGEPHNQEAFQTVDADPVKSPYIQRIEHLIPIGDIDLLLFDFPTRSELDLDGFGRDRKVPQADEHEIDLTPGLVQPLPSELINNFLRSGPEKVKPQGPAAPFKTSALSPEPEAPAGQGSRNLQDDLISRFVSRHEPMIIRPPQRPAETVDLSLDSLREDDDLLTETLARIYLQQGYHQKAIVAFEKLSLKYPEKSIYFASQIEKIKELIKNL